MKKYFPLFWVFYLLCAFSAHAGEGRYTIPLTGGGGGVLLEIAGNDKDRITYADFRHAIRAAGAAVILWGVGHRRLSFLFISFFSCPIFSCAVAFRKLLPVKRTGEHISIRRS